MAPKGRAAVEAVTGYPSNHVQVLPERIGAVGNSDFPGHYPGEDNSWNLERFKEKMTLRVDRLTPSRIEFDLIGIDASIANALRRICIAEVPTVAIENVYVYNNTSIVQDEVLAHRLGLVPIKVDPRKVKWKPLPTPELAETSNDENTIVFGLTVTCSRRADVRRDETDPEKLYENASVYSSEIKWQHKGRQYKHLNLPRPVDDDILLVKMRPGQQLNLLLYCVKGIGKTHAKWSPVATASYRLLPHIEIIDEIPPQLATKFQQCFPPGVVDLVYDERTGEKTKVVIANPRLDTVSREVLRHDEFKDRVRLSRIRDHFIYSIESTGAYKPEELLPEAIKVMQDKINEVENCLKKAFPNHVPRSD
ncbi:DNA-directed RNA polymerase core subunit rpc40 [Naganishia albida]|nr:DNA-directed RNA polymerase core subunit rpc40 [Naganishia albida]